MNAVTAAFLILSVPCKPRFIKAVVDCYTQTALVGWFPSDGALSYMVTATAMSGHNVTCEASLAHCELSGLLCGQSYSVSVKAVGETCSSIAHMSSQLVTGEQRQTSVTRLLGLGIVLFIPVPIPVLLIKSGSYWVLVLIPIFLERKSK